MFRNMVTSLFKYDRIRTTGAKAKELRRWADHIITLAKRGDLHARRQALAIVREKDVVHKLFENAAERFGAISGGYTRVVKLGRRPGDAAPVSLIELVVLQDTKKKKTKKKKVKAETAPKKAQADKKVVKKEKDKPKKVAKTEAAPAVKEDESTVKAKKSVKEKTKAPAEEEAVKAKTKSSSKKKDAGDQKEEKPAAKAAPKKKAAAEKEDASDTKDKKESTPKTAKDEK
jgi:large subunit ribosomal protein L17